MPETGKSSYLFSEQQIRLGFTLATTGMVVVLVVLLLLASARPQGRFRVLDGSAFQQQLTNATADLDGYQLLGGGRARIDIDRAMELLAERGLGAAGITAPEAP